MQSPPSLDPAAVRFVLCDLDGVVWLRRVAIPGAADAVAALRTGGRRVLFVTNNSAPTIADHEAALADIGIPAVGDIVTSAQAAASLVTPGSRAMVLGGDGVHEALGRHGVAVSRDGEASDAVVVGFDQRFDYRRLSAAARAIRGGALFVATNDDATYPTPDGPIPGAGAIVAAVATAGERSPLIAGKPHEPMAALVRERCGEGFTPAAALMVGDRFSTDGRFAATLGCPFALVRTGVTAPGSPPERSVALDVADLVAVAAALGC